MKTLGIALVVGAVAVYLYIRQVDQTSGDMESRGRVIIPTLGVTVLVLAGYILVTSL